CARSPYALYAMDYW
nr:immunoglobulin heavy chain junction region [Mus musculus]